MKKEMIEKFKNILEIQEQQISKRESDNKEARTVSKDEILDELDLATSDMNLSMSMRLGNRSSLYVKKVREALLRIREGNYGLCVDCGQEIGIKRLEARPTAELCIDCKEDAEKQENSSIQGRTPKSLGTKLLVELE